MSRPGSQYEDPFQHAPRLPVPSLPGLRSSSHDDGERLRHEAYP